MYLSKLLSLEINGNRSHVVTVMISFKTGDSVEVCEVVVNASLTVSVSLRLDRTLGSH